MAAFKKTSIKPKLLTAVKEYSYYRNFEWSVKGKLTIGRTYQTDGYYTLNGNRYYSIYRKDSNGNNKWYGYVNAGYTAPADHSAYYFSQKDERWNKYYVRNTNSTMYDIGCAPTSLAMALNIMHKDENYTDPWKVADTLARVGVLSDYGTNADYTVLPKALGSIGLNARYISNSDSAMRSALKNKHMILLNGAGQNPFTAYGHYILASTISSDGKVYILDPWNENNNGWWSMSTLRSRGLTRCFEIWAK